MAYDAEFKAAALIRLAENGNDYELTADQMGCSPRALRNWAAGEHVAKPAAKTPAKREKLHKKSAELAKPDLTVAEYLEQAVVYMLQNPPHELKGSAWATTVGILMDKWLLVQGQPTERTETISRLIEQLPENERDFLIREAEKIVAEASGDLGAG